MALSPQFFRPRYFNLLLVSSLAVNTLALALPLMTMQIYDRVLSNHAADTLIVLTVGVLTAAVMEFILRCCRSVMTGLNGANFEHEAGVEALERLLQAEPRSISATPATLAQDVSASARLKDYYGGQMMVTLLIDLPFVLVFLSLQAYLAGWLVLAPVAVLAVFLRTSWGHGRKLHALMHAREQQDNVRYTFITGALRSIHSIKALCLESRMVRRFEAIQRESGQLNYAIACANGQAGSLSYGFAQGMTVTVICAGAPLAVAGYISVGTLIACVLLSGQVMQPLQRGLAMWIRFQDIALAKERLGHLTRLPRRGFLPLDELKANHGGVRLEQVRFGHADGKPVLGDITLDIAPGDAVAITGAAGTGKTTLLEIIAGLHMPDRGRAVVSGMDAAAIPAADRARYIAYLPLNGLILRGSIMDNLTGFNPLLRSAAQEVAEQLGIAAAVSLLPSGYDTPLEGHSTDVISPGLKQRISVARALLHKPRVILFDNADHGMDNESYGLIFDMLARLKGKATLVLVSEDRNILSLADYVHELGHGQLAPVMAPSPLVAAQRIAARRGS